MFCGSCGAKMDASAPAIGGYAAQQGAPPPMPPVPPPSFGGGMPRMPNFGAGTAGASEQATVNGVPEQVYQSALQAIAAQGGQIVWQNPPQGAKFVYGFKNLLYTMNMTVRYDCDLSLSPMAAGQQAVRLNAKVDWGSAMGLLVVNGVLTILAAMLNPLLMYYMLFIGIIVVLGFWWSMSKSIPTRIAKQIFAAMGAGPTQAFQPAPAPYAAPSAPAYQPPPMPAAPPQAAAAADPTTAIVDQIKQLAALRDAGAITPAEFEAKKAELLSRI